jgi:hypothetical protein
MKNVTYVEVREYETTTTFAVIDHGNDEFTTMPKSTYDELKANEAKIK